MVTYAAGFASKEGGREAGREVRGGDPEKVGVTFDVDNLCQDHFMRFVSRAQGRVVNAPGCDRLALYK